MTTHKRLDDLNKDELLATTRQILVEADALSSRVAAVNEISVAVNKSLDLKAILRVIGKQAKWLLDFNHCSVCLEEDGIWQVKVLFGDDDVTDIDLMQCDNVGAVLKHKYPKIIHTSTSCEFLSEYQSQLLLPLQAAGHLLGTINFASEESNQYSQDDMRIAYMLSLQLSSAIRNAQIVQELNRTQAELELRIEELDAYNHTIAHDLKSPLSTILLSSQIINLVTRDVVLPEKAQTSLASIEHNTVHMSEMIDRLLWLAKLRQDEIELEPVNMLNILERVESRFSTQLTENHITLKIADDLPCAIAQPQWVEEVFANFVSNAIKYIGIDNSCPTIEIRAAKIADMIRYQVIDNGTGIKEKHQKNLFEMFSRVEGTQVEGTGIGLSIVNRIVKRMNGTCGVASTFGEGSTFWFELHAVNTATNVVQSEQSTDSSESAS
ncbi:MAG: GAF domain-containing sensor histidine kinase [Chloroflexota bacterium]